MKKPSLLVVVLFGSMLVLPPAQAFQSVGDYYEPQVGDVITADMIDPGSLMQMEMENPQEKSSGDAFK